MNWLIRQDFAEELRSRAERVPHTVEQQSATWAAARMKRRAPGEPPALVTVRGDTAVIQVTGPLTKRPDFWTWLLAGANTSYDELREALAFVAAAPVANAVLELDSPGGTVDGLFETLAAIEAFPKPIRSRATQATSAAYALAAATRSIEAIGPAAAFGSVGVVTSIHVRSDVVDVTSSGAPKKRPDVRTEEGRAIVREHLDQVEELFVEAIARGRKTTPEAVKANYGRGAVLLAKQALAAGMIDSIAGLPLAKGSTTMTMTADQIRLQYPDAYAAILAIGRTEERERVVGFLDLAAHAGEAGMKQAIKDIRSGAEASPAKAMSYMGLAMNKRDQDAYAADCAAAEEAMLNAAHGADSPSAGARDTTDRLADALGLPPAPRELLATHRRISGRM